MKNYPACNFLFQISSLPHIPATTSDKPSSTDPTTLKPTTPTTITTTTTPTTTTTTTTPTTTTTTPTTTTKAPARLGGNCTGEDAVWCGTSISGGVVCDNNNECQCAPSFFRKDDTTCLNSKSKSGLY